MTLRTTGVSWLTLMMRAERLRRGDREIDTAWLLHGPGDPDVVEPEDETPDRLLAAE